MKKNLRNQQSAPVQRENAGTAKASEKGLVPLSEELAEQYSGGWHLGDGTSGFTTLVPSTLEIPLGAGVYLW